VALPAPEADVANWQAGGFYSPGAIVSPLTVNTLASGALTNPDFESGDTGWTKTSQCTIGQFGAAFTNLWSLRIFGSGGTNGNFTNDARVPVNAGQSITATCRVRTGFNVYVVIHIHWYNASNVLIRSTASDLISDTGGAWVTASVTDTAPAGAAYVSVGGGAADGSESGTDTVYFDNFAWDYAYSVVPSELVYKAVQADAAYSGTAEPVWPLVAGSTVVDGGVTWQAVAADGVVWEAVPILKSGTSEPTWPNVVGAVVSDGTVLWEATSGQIEDAKNPQSANVAMAASKLFATDRDIVAFSATVNPLDWSTLEDAGYLPTGLQTYGANDAAALGLYRGNLIVFNSAGFQMWQVDEDPASMALLDALPIGSTYHKAIQPVGNDLVFTSAVGVRNIAIAGASTNLQAGGLGEPVDELVKAKLAEYEADAGFEPVGLYIPSRGQYWLIFGDEAFILTITGSGGKSKTWSRYTFPEAITDWTLLGNDLYLRTATHKVWKLEDGLAEDDVAATVVGGNVAYTARRDAFSPSPATTMNLSLTTTDFVPNDDGFPDAILVLSIWAFNNSGAVDTSAPTVTIGGIAASVLSVKDTGTGYVRVIAAAVRVPPTGLASNAVVITYPTLVISGTTVRASVRGYYNVDESSDGFALDNLAESTTHPNPTSALSVPAGGAVHVVDNMGTGTDFNVYADSYIDSTEYLMTALQFNRGAEGYRLFASALTEQLIPRTAASSLVGFSPIIAFVMAPSSAVGPDAGTPFESYIHWPHLDLGAFGRNKMVEGFDLVMDVETTVTAGPETVAISIGYDQLDRTVRTADYDLDADNLTNDMVPFPVAGPSFDVKLTPSPSTVWTFYTGNLYINDMGR
jgi:hypothetical protein